MKMKTEQFQAAVLRRYLRKHKIATLPELKTALGTKSSMTVFRKLNELGYRTSYSHRGKYYALDELVRFNDQGLWSYGPVKFSRYGTLLETVRMLVINSPMGYGARELEGILNTEVREPLLHLFYEGQIHRIKQSGRYVYVSSDPRQQKQQLLIRQDEEAGLNFTGVPGERNVLGHRLKASIILFFSLLDEKQRRLYAGLESLKLGHGGDQKIGRLLGVDNHTVAKGRKELLSRYVEIDRIRKKGGGRKSVLKKHPRS